MSEVVFSPDVLIVGGGAAGVAAAVAAGSLGLEVALIEKKSYAGGKATASYVGTICGLYQRSEKRPEKYAVGGFPKEFASKIEKQCHVSPVFYKDGLCFLPYLPFQFKLICDRYLAKNCHHIFFHTSISGVVTKHGQIHKVEAIAGDGRVSFLPKTVIDCSGEAIVGTLAGLPVIQEGEYQSAAQVFGMDGVKNMEAGTLNLVLLREIRKATVNGQLPQTLEKVSVVPGSCINGHVLLKLSLPLPVVDHHNRFTQLEMEARSMVAELAAFLVKQVGAFKGARLTMVAPEVGMRTGKRHIGKYMLNKSDVLACRKFDDGICNGAWPIEKWNHRKVPDMQFFDLDDFYQVPAGCLQSAQISNLYFAGRNISADSDAIASARVIGICMGTGYAAGALASHLVLGKSQGEAIGFIRKEQVDGLG